MARRTKWYVPALVANLLFPARSVADLFSKQRCWLKYTECDKQGARIQEKIERVEMGYSVVL
jgi:hypothetical protein